MVAALTLNYFSFDIKQVEILVAVLTFLIGTFVGLLIFLQNRQSWTNRLFTLLVLAFDGYIVFNYFSLHPLSSSPEEQLFWIRMVMFMASFIGPILLLFVHTFPGEKIKIGTAYLSAIIFLGVSSAVASILPLVFSSIEYVDGRPLPIPGPGMVLFLLDFLLIIISFFILISRYRKATGVERAQQLYLLFGIVGSLTLIGIFTVVFVVILKTATMVFMGPIFFLILIGAIAYAMVRHSLFNVKIIATNILVITLWIILFSKIFTSASFIEVFIDLLILGLVIFFGIFIMQSVKKEVDQRERLEKLAKDLEAANKKLRELDELKSEFLSFASHQIKAPLAVIKGFATLIGDGSYGEVPPKVKETIGTITESVDRTIALVSDFLSVHKIEEGKMDYKMVKTNGVEIVMELVEGLAMLAKNKNLKLNFFPQEEDLEIKADVQRIRQVFQNLIENAIKYTDRGFVKVKIHIEGKDFVFSVTDSGHGLAPELIPHLFEEFKRGDSISRQIEGSGLGLFIARQIVEAHGGKIWAESEGEGKGSTFYVSIPLAR